MRRPAGAADQILDDAAIIVALVPVDEGVMDTDIGQPAGQDQGLNLQPLQQYLKVGAVEGGIAALGHEIVARAVIDLLGRDLGRSLSLDRVDVLGAVQLTPEIDHVGSMDLLDEDHRHLRRTRGADQLADQNPPFFSVIHMRNATILTGDVRAAALPIHHDQCRLSDDQRTLGVLRFRHLDSISLGAGTGLAVHRARMSWIGRGKNTALRKDRCRGAKLWAVP